MKVKKFGKKQIQLDCGNETTEFGEVKNGWFGATPAVYAFATKNFPVGTEVEVKLKANHNPQWAPVITKMTKAGGNTAPVSKATQTETATPVPADTTSGIKIQLWRDDKRVEVEENGKLMLYNCTDAVYNFGKKAIPVGELVEIEISNGTITRIVKKNKEKKADKTPVTESTNSYYGTGEFMKPRTPEERAEMMAESIAKTTAETVKVLEGQVDIEALPSVIKKIYALYYDIITETACKIKEEYFK